MQTPAVGPTYGDHRPSSMEDVAGAILIVVCTDGLPLSTLRSAVEMAPRPGCDHAQTVLPRLRTASI